MSRKSVTVFHFDDEPATVEWLGGAIFTRYRIAQPGCAHTRPNLVEREDGLDLAFTLSMDEMELRIRYRLFSVEAVFLEAFAVDGKPTDIVLMDLMAELPNGRLELRGTECYAPIRAKICAQRVFFLTAYPRALTDLVGAEVLPQQLLVKPPDVSRLVDVLIEKIEEPVEDEQASKS